MAKKVHSGLGKGLGALLKDAEPDFKEKIADIDIALIESNPFQPRKNFDDTGLDELAQSIKQYGVLQPVLLRKAGDKYQLIAGERRLKASQKADKKVIPAVIRNYDDKQTAQIALIENLQREDLNALEEATAYNNLLKECSITQSELAQYVGKSRSHVANFLRLLQLSDIVKEQIDKGNLNMGQAKPLLSIENKNLQEQTALYIIANELSARDAEKLVKKIDNNKDYFIENTKNALPIKDIFINDAEDKLKMLFGNKVKIKTGKKAGKIEIEFLTESDLDRIVEILLQQKKSKINDNDNTQFFV